MQKDFYQPARNSELSSFLPSTLELFAEPWQGIVTEPVVLYQTGRVQITSYSWRARLCELHCQATLLPGQPIQAIARTGNVLIVIPEHCLLQEWTRQPTPKTKASKMRDFLTHAMIGWLQPSAI